jgi:hypothetical protein
VFADGLFAKGYWAQGYWNVPSTALGARYGLPFVVLLPMRAGLGLSAPKAGGRLCPVDAFVELEQ